MPEHYLRTPAHYDGTSSTSKQLQELLPHVIKRLASTIKTNPQHILDLWPDIIGEPFCRMTKAWRFESGVVYIRAKNSACLDLLDKDRARILELYRKRACGVEIQKIVFRIG